MHQLRMSPFSPFCGWTSSLPEVFFFFHLFSAPPTSPVLPTTYLPPLTLNLPPPSYLPPTNPTPRHSIARARIVERKFELWCCCCGAVLELCSCSSCVAVVVESEQELERPWDPRAHDQVRYLPFFFLCLFCLKRHRCATTSPSSSLSSSSSSSSPSSFAKKATATTLPLPFFLLFFAAEERKEEGNGSAFYFLCWVAAQS